MKFKVKSNGYVYAKDVTVTVSTFPDYVFNSSYKKLSIDSLSIFIKKEKHLPLFPKQESVIENGLSLGEINIRLVEQIEIMTLYIIELNERLKAAESEITNINIRK